MFRRAPSRGGRGRRAAGNIVVVFWVGWIFRVVVFSIFFFLRTDTEVRGRLASFTSLLVPECVQGAII